MDTIVVWDRFPLCGDVVDFRFVRIESHLPVIFPGLKTYQDHVANGVSRQGYGWCDTEGNRQRRVELLIGLWRVDHWCRLGREEVQGRCLEGARWGSWERALMSVLIIPRYGVLFYDLSVYQSKDTFMKRHPGHNSFVIILSEQYWNHCILYIMSKLKERNQYQKQ